jgi:hypothetical protein
VCGEEFGFVYEAVVYRALIGDEVVGTVTVYLAGVL